MAAHPRAAHEGRRGRLALISLAAAGVVLLGLSALAEATVAPDGRLTEPFAAIALGTLLLTAAGIGGLALMFRTIRRRSSCGTGGC